MSAPPASLAAAFADRYTVERELGRGGMATVYLARDLKHDRLVALKLLQPELAAAIGPERFLREIRVAARLQHPHILALFDSGEAVVGAASSTPDSRPTTLLYYVMPYVVGESLRQRLERETQLPLDEALTITRQVLAALGYAHAQGIVHRDIKPENILLQDDQAMVADFGIARAVSSAGGEKLTETGLALGTPTYMSPEQAAGEEHIDGRSDIYSLGCVVYEMLAGETPFTGRTPQVILAKRLSEPVPHLSTIREVPRAIEQAVARALARSPADRFTTAAQFADALEDRIGEALPRSRPARPAEPDARRWGRGWIGLASLAILAALGVGLWRRPRSPESALDPNLVAVAPFDVLDPKLALWRDGLVDVLARTLDGLGPLRTVSPTIVLRRWSGRADPASARELGRRTGARLAVFGQLVGLGGDSARLSATLLDVATGARRSEFDRADLAARLSPLADSLSVAFLRDLGISARGKVRLASVGTRSIVALKAFLQGEQHFRRGALDSAIASFERAVELDSTFALALRRLDLAHGWRNRQDDNTSYRFYIQAGRFNRGLSPRDSLLVTADSLQAGSDDPLLDSTTRASLVRRRFLALEAASRSYPGDPEIWYQLGEAREHYGFGAGATVAQELDAFDRSIALDSTFAEAYPHPIFRTLDRGDCGRALSYLQPAGSMHLAPDNVPAAPAVAPILSRILDGTAGRRAEIQPIVDTLSGEMLHSVTWMLRHCPDSAETDVWLARQLAGPRPGRAPMQYPADANNILALSLMNRGHLRASYRVLRDKPILVDGSSGFFFLTLALFGVVPKDTAAAVFRSWLKGPDVGPWPLSWWAGQGDTSSIRAFIERALAAASAGANNEGTRGDAGELARLGQVYLALARRDTAEAWRRLAGMSWRPDVDLLRARLLAAQRNDSAAATLFDWETWEGALNVLQRLLQAQVAERLGRRDDALRSYQFVIDMWRHPDPELSPYVAEAQAGLVRLTGEAAARR